MSTRLRLRLRRGGPNCPRLRRAARPAIPKYLAEYGLFGVFGVGLAAGDDVGAGQPAVQVDVAAARGAERRGGLGSAGLPHSGQGFGGGLGAAGRVGGGLSWH